MNFRRFKGTDSTFSQFPERLKHVVSETTDNVVVESVVFPAYEVLLMHAALKSTLMFIGKD